MRRARRRRSQAFRQVREARDRRRNEYSRAFQAALSCTEFRIGSSEIEAVVAAREPDRWRLVFGEALPSDR